MNGKAQYCSPQWSQCNPYNNINKLFVEIDKLILKFI